MKTINLLRKTNNGKDKTSTDEGGRLDAFQTGGISPPKNKKGKVIPFRASSETLSHIEGGIVNNFNKELRRRLNHIKLTEFLSPFFPDEDETIHLRAFPAKGSEGRAEILTTTRFDLASNSALQERLKRLNKTQGIYFVVNAGGDNDADITRFNAYFAEIDDRPIDEQIDLFNQAPLPPSILLITDKSVHAYYFVNGDCSEEEWREVQSRLISHFRSDPKIKNPSRVMRLPHFNHVSYSKSGDWQYKKVELVEFNPERRYTVKQMRKAFPSVASLIQETPAISTKAEFDTWDELHAEVRNRILALPHKITKDGWVETKAVCHGGKGNSGLTFNIITGAYYCKNEPSCSGDRIREALGLPSRPIGTGFGEDRSLSFSTIQWPEPLAPAAFYGLAGAIVRLIEPHTEADPAALLIQLLVMFGNVIGRNAHFVAEADKHYLNLFVGLVGDTAKGRKGTSLSQVQRFFNPIDQNWTKDHIQSGLSSGEGLIYAVRDQIEKQEPIKNKGRVEGYQKVITDEGIADKRLLIVEPELASTLRVLGREGNTLSAQIRQAWDTGTLRVLNKNSPIKTTHSHISLIGHITRNELTRYLGGTEASNGFANRFLWMSVRRSKILPEGGKLDRENLNPLVKQLKEAIEFARDIDEMERDEEARKLWIEVYPELSEGKPGLLGAITSRAEAQVMRIACIYALLDRSSVIRKPHLEAALALWKYSEDSARYIFADSVGDSIADKILYKLQETENGLTKTQIRDLFSRNLTANQMNRALATLTEAGKVKRVQEDSEGRGRPTERWVFMGITQLHTESEDVLSQSEAEKSRFMSYVVEEQKHQNSVDADTTPKSKNAAFENTEEGSVYSGEGYDQNDITSKNHSVIEKMSEGQVGSKKTKERDSKRKLKMVLPARTKKLNLKPQPVKSNKERVFRKGMFLS